METFTQRPTKIQPSERYRARFFWLTRNPYSRTFPAKNKIGPKKNPNAVWHPFCNRFGFKPNIQPSLEDFLIALLEDDNPLTMDMHYRCQHVNLHYQHIKPAFIGRIERFSEIESYLSSKSVKIISRNRHKTGAMNTYKDEITQREAKLIEKFYSFDFEVYGYNKKLEDLFVPSTIFQTQHVSEFYTKLLISDQQAT